MPRSRSKSEISSEEVRKHCTRRSAWIIINNEVLDVTNFLNEHPGGEESILEFAGLDATQAFNDVGHSKDAREMKKKYKIGVLPAHEVDAQNCPLKWVLLALGLVVILGFAYKKYSE